MSIFRFLNPFHVIKVLKAVKNATEGYGKVLAAIEDLNIRLKDADARLSDMDGRLSGVDVRLRDMDDRLSGMDAGLSSMDVMLNDMDGRCKDIDNRLKDLSTICEFQKTKIHMLEKREKNQIVEKKGLEVKQNVQELNEPKSQHAYSNIDYFDFENHFRGSIAHIREAQGVYLKYFEGHDNVIDLGCGRGEFLELLKENEIDAQGVDSYEEFVEMCRLRNLKVTCADALEFLRVQEKVGGIFAAQLIEHLTIDQVVTLCELAYEKLEEGAYVILETPNPKSLSMFTNAFYIDPSHDKPRHPLTVQYILQKAGFKEVDIVYTEASEPQIAIPPIKMDNMEEFNNAMKQVENILFGSQDYAVIAKR